MTGRPMGRRPPVATTSRPRGLADATRRIHAASGILEEASFLGSPGERVFTFTHRPAGRARAGLVVCSPLYAEFLHNYRKEAILGRSLAASGIAVHRFHYRGTGNSEGDSPAFDPMLEDALEAAERFRGEVSIERLAFLGTRLGGLVASAAARRFEGAPVALWEPPLDPVAHFREILRAARIRDLKDGRISTEPNGSSLEQLERDGMADVLGYSVRRDALLSFRGHTLPEELGEDPRPVLLVQLARGQEIRDPYARMLASLEARGFAVDARAIHATASWWFSGNPDDAARTLEAVVQATWEWLEAVFR